MLIWETKEFPSFKKVFAVNGKKGLILKVITALWYNKGEKQIKLNYNCMLD